MPPENLQGDSRGGMLLPVSNLTIVFGAQNGKMKNEFIVLNSMVILMLSSV